MRGLSFHFTSIALMSNVLPSFFSLYVKCLSSQTLEIRFSTERHTRLPCVFNSNSKVIIYWRLHNGFLAVLPIVRRLNYINLLLLHSNFFYSLSLSFSFGISSVRSFVCRFVFVALFLYSFRESNCFVRLFCYTYSTSSPTTTPPPRLWSSTLSSSSAYSSIAQNTDTSIPTLTRCSVHVFLSVSRVFSTSSSSSLSLFLLLSTRTNSPDCLDNSLCLSSDFNFSNCNYSYCLVISLCLSLSLTLACHVRRDYLRLFRRPCTATRYISLMELLFHLCIWINRIISSYCPVTVCVCWVLGEWLWLDATENIAFA